MTRRSFIMGLAATAEPPTEAPTTEQRGTDVTPPALPLQPSLLPLEVYCGPSVTVEVFDAGPGPDPVLLSRFRAACMAFDTYCATWVDVDKRVKAGEQYCRANPKNATARKLLLQLNQQRTCLEANMQREAQEQLDLQNEITSIFHDGKRRYVCPHCLAVRERSCECWKLLYESDAAAEAAIDAALKTEEVKG